MSDQPDSGLRKVQVSLQVQNVIPLPREERRRALERIFDDIERDVLAPRGATGDLSSLSVSGQTIEAELPDVGYEETVAELAKRHVRVDRLRLMRIAPPF